MRGVIVSAFAQPDLHVGSRTPVHPEYVPGRTRAYPLMTILRRTRLTQGPPIPRKGQGRRACLRM